MLLHAANKRLIIMAGFAAQAAIRSKWTDLIESSTIEVPGEVTEGVRSVVGWLKQACLIQFQIMLIDFNYLQFL